MNMGDFVKAIPDLFLYFIPGFVCLKTVERYAFKKEHSKYTTTVYSILYSFIIMFIYKMVIGSIYVNCRQEIKQIIYIVLGFLLGIFLTGISKIDKNRLLKKLRINTVSRIDTPWEKIIKTPQGAKCRVFLKSGEKYEGSISCFTSDPNETKKEILLHTYKKYIRNEKPINPPKDLWKCVFASGYSYGEDKDTVLIKYDDVYSLEIETIPKEESEGRQSWGVDSE